MSLFGDQVSLLAIPLAGVLVLHANAPEMGVLVAAGLVPSLLFSIIAGVWLDQHGRRRMHMIGADIARAAALISIPIAAWLHALTLLQLYAAAFLIGSCDVVFFVAYSSLFTSLVRREQYVAANSLLNGSRAVAEVGGQSLGGVLVGLLTAPVALLADAASFLVSALSLCRIAPVEAPTSARGVRALADGVRFIVRTPMVRNLLCVSATLNFFNFVFSAVFVLFVVTELGVGAAALGLLLGLGATGTLLGALFAGALVKRAGLGWTYLAGAIAFPVPLLLIPAAPSGGALTYVFMAAAEFVSGVGLMIFDIAAGSITATIVPGELRSRVSGAYRMVNYGVRPVGALLGGSLGAAIGLRSTVWIGVVGAALCGLWLIHSPLLQLRQIDSEVAAPGLRVVA